MLIEKLYNFTARKELDWEMPAYGEEPGEATRMRPVNENS